MEELQLGARDPALGNGRNSFDSTLQGCKDREGSFHGFRILGRVAYVFRCKFGPGNPSVAEPVLSLEVNNCDENLRKLRDAKVMYQQTLLQEETFWRQKSRVKWLAEGDKNILYQ
ncbi:hypothetical protein NE237_024924 [Protea cynaroides]|uniref:Uncharacterized protein n=1 Tax=Protea cynaroides TaxID=273540 RepID=A0A9Q0K194_9MAGN|nr:hypothetical protein NE237_024924 [Protea cynaroides]